MVRQVVDSHSHCCRWWHRLRRDAEASASRATLLRSMRTLGWNAWSINASHRSGGPSYRRVREAFQDCTAKPATMNRVCEACGQEMSPGVACTQPDYDGIPRIPYGSEPAKFGGNWPLTDPLPNLLRLASAGSDTILRWTLHDRCRDCNTPAGGLHHPGCDMEDCPVCGWQVLSCGCE
jgi:hypothetical protein